MSEVDPHVTATLLPQSKVAVFSKDQDTLDAARAIGSDWRFARVGVQAIEGNVETASQAYEEYKSPDIVIVQTDTIDAGFVARLEALAAQCEEGTEAIVIGPDNDVNLYRKLIDMGVSDYLVRPVSAAVLGEVIAKTLIEQHGVTGSRLVAFVGAKGGVGASTIARNVGWALSDVLDQKTMILDAAGGWSSMPVGLGFEPAATYKEAAKAAEKHDEDSLSRMLQPVNSKLGALATGSDAMLERSVTPEQMEALVETLMVKYPAVIADVSGAAPDIKKLILARAHHIVLVTTASVACLRLARSLAMEIREIRGGDAADISLFLNMTGLTQGSELSTNDIQKAMDLPVSASLAFDPKLFVRLESEGAALSQDKTGKEQFDSTIVPFAQRVFNVGRAENTKGKPEAVAASGVFSNILGKISKK